MKKSYPKIQEEVRKLYQENGWDTDPTLLIVAMSEELGELCARWLAEHPDYEKAFDKTDPIEDDVGDLAHLVLAFCNAQGIDFEEAVRATIKKRKKN